MADPLGSVQKIVQVGLAIQQAVETARRNKEDCHEIRKRVLRVDSILQQLAKKPEVTSSPVMSGVLEDLEGALRRAHRAVTGCQGTTTVCFYLRAAGMSAELRRVQNDIEVKTMVGMFALNAYQVTLTLTDIQHAAPPPPPPPVTAARRRAVASCCFGHVPNLELEEWQPPKAPREGRARPGPREARAESRRKARKHRGRGQFRPPGAGAAIPEPIKGRARPGYYKGRLMETGTTSNGPDEGIILDPTHQITTSNGPDKGIMLDPMHQIIESEEAEAVEMVHIIMPSNDTSVVESEGKEECDVPAVSDTPFASLLPGFKNFSLSELMDATKDFSDENLIRRGSFAAVYKGVLHDGQVVTIKKFQTPYSVQEECPDNEITLISKLQHKNIVELLGYGYEVIEKEAGGEGQNHFVHELHLFSIQEHMPNGDLEQMNNGLRIDWPSRLRIVQGIAHGVHYLHEQQVLHLDLKPTYILLDSDMNPKICEFETATMFDNNSKITSNLVGTMGYMPPELLMKGLVTIKADVYAFGVILLETVSSMCKSGAPGPNASVGWAWKARKAGRMKDEFDTSLCEESQLKEIKGCMEIGLLCTQDKPEDRPTMGDVVGMLEGKKKLPIPKKPRYIK